MNFRDQRVTCSVCDKVFIFTVTDQRQIYESGQADSGLQPEGIAPPTECPSCRHQEPQTGRAIGRIKWFSEEKGYGFISRPNASDVFFHRSQVVDEPPASLQEGAAVTFDQISTDRGVEAQQVKVEEE